jgi:hypothetical protein
MDAAGPLLALRIPILIGVLAAIAGEGKLDTIEPTAADATPDTNSRRENFMEMTSRPQLTRIKRARRSGHASQRATSQT